MSSIGLLPESLQSSLQSVVARVNACGGGIQIVLLSTSEGVSLGRLCLSPDWDDEMLANLESTWAPPGKQLPLLQQGEAQSVTAYYDQLTLMHIYLTPVVVTLLIDPDANMGAIKATAMPLLKEVLEPLCQTLISSLSPDTTNAQSPYYQ
jgi:Mitogen-activated protein kinase kinase 1 interacting